jgi:hypothetical protein
MSGLLRLMENIVAHFSRVRAVGLGIERQTASRPRSPFDSISFAGNESESKNQSDANLNNRFAL